MEDVEAVRTPENLPMVVREARAPANIAIELLIANAQRAILAAAYPEAEALIKSIKEAVSTGSFDDPLAKEYLEIVLAMREAGYEVLYLSLQNGHATVQATNNPPESTILELQKVDGVAAPDSRQTQFTGEIKMNPENQFDFWLGEWDARWGEDGTATNTITRILDGKIVQEDFVAPDLHGMSFSSYDPERQLWCQTWVDSNGTYLDFTGTFEDGKMTLVRDAIVRGERCKQRMIWYDIEEQQFNWNWERSNDGGQTWRVLWQIHYTRK